MLAWLLGLPRAIKRLISVIADMFFLISSLFAAYFLTQHQERTDIPEIALAFAVTLPVTLFIFTKLGLYRAVIRYIGQHALGAVLAGIVSSAFVLALLFGLFKVHDKGNLIFVYAILALISSGGLRLLARMFLVQRNNGHKERVLIYGAGSSGRQLAQALINGEQYHPVVFVDDDTTLHRSTILGVPVGAPAQITSLIKSHNISRILLALPSVSRSRRREVLDALEELPIPVQSIPGMSDLVDGSMRIDELQDVKIEDLLGRDPVAPKTKLMRANIHGKVVMVTGAGGSIGSELCRQIITSEPKTLVLFELSEFSLYSIEQELSALIKQQQLDIQLVPIMGTAQRRNRLETVMKAFKVQTVYHAAAYKHVPLVEYNVVEGVRNNVFGTWYAAEAAIASGVETFVLISTDKAVRPTNVMGASKRLAELVLQALSERQSATRFCMVRFGNVLGSSGSVVPLFREQIRRGGPVTVTHKDIIRYFMTIPEAAQLVIQAGAMGQGGDVFVLDMGEPVKIADLAKRMIHLMGLEVKDEVHPNGDIEIQYSGLRPGEKLYEELLIGESVRETAHPRIMAADEVCLGWSQMESMLLQLDTLCDSFAVEQIIELMRVAPTGFNYSCASSDLVVKAGCDIEFGVPVAVPLNVVVNTASGAGAVIAAPAKKYC
ncbi:NDP-sugar epimerase, includes UDP-GlcNAc-inverting 4,6-dehydratase FlaA1 and capsular polysaccharide biosynthesis protein EpsC [Rheinheimera pacifica]|uniref:NDP-sugar epimerase, includes UDP-GlcNAc-inverting 4,6-dehydratase FlaA1 and capsular polysaccharide biosynthesis protein EpsC n=1 Tax=Rheinheimera pacifica TaxID=173990 RepID=A0A1H6KIX6_9GAMM|nr:nucleoside-diphosphate sugar epimerase/dehydratase [Rheinheimera pacifica]SEH75560.1 NDP-sugar epimerase, includes UDP-GlcNAc-inverting 4,6-dehydratase FlaA1 and capsular polysaccharide biosynthesis protein EpsC [Rheinheimera pacifica]